MLVAQFIINKVKLLTHLLYSPSFYMISSSPTPGVSVCTRPPYTCLEWLLWWLSRQSQSLLYAYGGCELWSEDMTATDSWASSSMAGYSTSAASVPPGPPLTIFYYEDVRALQRTIPTTCKAWPQKPTVQPLRCLPTGNCFTITIMSQSTDQTPPSKTKAMG